jgi:hypothetical protein
MHDPYYSPPSPAIVIGSHPSRPLRVDLPLKNGPRAVAWLSFLSLSSTEVERPVVNPERPSFSAASPPVSKLARRIHGWSWQAVRPYLRSVISSLIPLVVPHGYGHGCCLRHSVGFGRAPGTPHESRGRLFLHKRLALHPQLVGPLPSSHMYDRLFLWFSFSLTADA